MNLCAVWRQFETDKIIYHILDPDKDPVTSIALEMLTEELPQLLQTLLVSVEQTINRIPFDDLSFPSSSPPPSPAATANDDFVRKLSQQNVASPNGSPKCGLKRRELITRNHKTLHGRYAMRRMSLNKSENESSSTSSPMHSNSSTIKESNAMPLFCLGGSFPHIDSDEDSGADDASKSSSERKLDNFALEFTNHFRTRTKQMQWDAIQFQLARKTKLRGREKMTNASSHVSELSGYANVEHKRWYCTERWRRTRANDCVLCVHVLTVHAATNIHRHCQLTVTCNTSALHSFKSVLICSTNMFRHFFSLFSFSHLPDAPDRVRLFYRLQLVSSNLHSILALVHSVILNNKQKINASIQRTCSIRHTHNYLLPFADAIFLTPPTDRLHHDIVAPRSITDLPEKLLTSGVYLSGKLWQLGASRNRIIAAFSFEIITQLHTMSNVV